ncbi:MAG: rhomboid family intramembrane serine protease [Cyclobacteriaceae bacterium]|nr:rhomboid family intramembrane serine protease [Cyclobacteriaceae bacterium]
MFRLTPIVKNLIIINVVIFLGQMFAPKIDIGSCFGLPEGVYGDDVVTAYLALFNVHTSCFKPYQLFTYMFAHGNFMHIFFNMLSIAFLGPILESFLGQNKFLLFYIITGIGAAVFSVAIDLIMGGGAGSMLGASGAIYGLLMAFGMIFPNMEVRLLFPPVAIKAKYMVFIFGGLTFLMDRSGDVAHFAHLGGAVIGFIVVRAWRNQNQGGYF